MTLGDLDSYMQKKKKKEKKKKKKKETQPPTYTIQKNKLKVDKRQI